jgi:hypothetical protein
VQLPHAENRREVICTHTLSSGNVRHAQRLRIARVTFALRILLRALRGAACTAPLSGHPWPAIPQRLPYSAPLRGEKNPTEAG